MTRLKIPLILPFLIFFIPVNIYMIGDRMGAGVQWLVFRYQVTYMGSSLILAGRDLTYVLTGLMGGRSGLSILIWLAGVVLMTLALLLVVLAYQKKNPDLIKKGSLLTVSAGIVLFLAIVTQYGLLLSGPAGFAIPIGIPIILFIGWINYTRDSGIEDEPDPGEQSSPDAEDSADAENG